MGRTVANDASIGLLASAADVGARRIVRRSGVSQACGRLGYEARRVGAHHGRL